MLRVGFAWLLSAMLVSGCASDVATDYDSSVELRVNAFFYLSVS